MSVALSDSDIEVQLRGTTISSRQEDGEIVKFASHKGDLGIPRNMAGSASLGSQGWGFLPWALCRAPHSPEKD